MGIECNVCDMVVKLIEEYIISGKTIGYIESRLNYICSILPKSYVDTCYNLVAELPRIIEYIFTIETPDTVCKQLEFCLTNNTCI